MPDRLLCITAHPDDECFAFGGALALAAQAGWTTHVLCLTDGQAATNRGDATDARDLGRMRREELAASCAILGVGSHELWHYQDATLEFADLQLATRRLVERMRTFQPQVVLTFGLDGGMNAHQDHATVSALTSLAFHWSGRPKRFPDLLLPIWLPQRLYHASTDYLLPDREAVLPAPWTVDLDITAVQETKRNAFFAHTSQQAIWQKVKPYRDEHGSHEFYTLVADTAPHAMRNSASLL